MRARKDGRFKCQMCVISNMVLEISNKMLEMNKMEGCEMGKAIRALGVSVCLIGALMMAVGESILGANHTGIATVIGIVGIGLIATSSKR